MSTNPHDAVFKKVLGDPEHARGALQAVLPATLSHAIDWTKLTRQPGSFVEPGLPDQHTDLLFSVEWRDGGDEALVYLLFEHQSTADGGLMAFRLLRYQVRIWERWRDEHPNAKHLPVIVPIVLYHGAEAWSARRTFGELIEMPDDVRLALQPYLVQFEYLLDDLSTIPDEVLRGRATMTALSRLLAICFKHGRTRPDLVQILGSGWLDVLREVASAPNGLEALALVMRYILEVNEYVEPEALQALLESGIGPEAKDTVMTAGQRLIQQGKSELLLKLLRRRFGAAVDAKTEHRVMAASAEQIEAWSDRVLSAGTLTELMGT